MRHRARFVLLTCVAAVFVMLAASATCSAQARFGTRCQEDFEASWLPNLSDIWDDCGKFTAALSETDTKIFYFNLHHARQSFSTCSKCDWGANNVQLLYTNTHGGAFSGPANAALGMWDKNVNALSNTDNWRFGDQLALFAQNACKTLTVDSQTIARWLSTFRGGLRMAMGSPNLLHDGDIVDGGGKDFARGLQHRKSLKWAWFDGMSNFWVSQDVAVLATGSSLTGAHNAEADCNYRLDKLTWQNFEHFAKWRDNQVEWMCWSYIID